MEPRPRTPKFIAGVDLLRRTGTAEFEIRWCGSGDDSEQPPIAWVAVAIYPGKLRWECAGAKDPETAVMRLCELVIDGGTCTHCGKTTIFDEGFDDSLNHVVAPRTCWTMWDPELTRFRRGCE